MQIDVESTYPVLVSEIGRLRFVPNPGPELPLECRKRILLHTVFYTSTVWDLKQFVNTEKDFGHIANELLVLDDAQEGVERVLVTQQESCFREVGLSLSPHHLV